MMGENLTSRAREFVRKHNPGLEHIDEEANYLEAFAESETKTLRQENERVRKSRKEVIGISVGVIHKLQDELKAANERAGELLGVIRAIGNYLDGQGVPKEYNIISRIELLVDSIETDRALKLQEKGGRIKELEGENWNYKTALERIGLGEHGIIPTKDIAKNALYRVALQGKKKP